MSINSLESNPLRSPAATEPDRENDLNASYYFPLVPRVIEVVSTTALSETMVRVRFTGADIATVGSVAPEDHVKLFFDLDESGQPRLPGIVDDRWQGGRDLTFRDYTIRSIDAADSVIDIDFVLHDHGVAGRWAGAAKPGMRLGMLGPRGAFRIKDVFETYFLAADETALPALARWLEYARPDAKIHAFVEIYHEGSKQTLPEHPSATITYLLRESPQQPSALARVAAEFDFSSSGLTYAWVAGEASDIKPARSIFKTALSMDRDHYDVDGYWKRGAANHDHHDEQDED